MSLKIEKRIVDGVKILADGDLKISLAVRAHKFSARAVKKIKAAGGTVEVIVCAGR